VTNLARLPTWADKQHIHAVVETPRGSRCKLEFDPKLKVFTLSKPLLAGLPYPYDWGFVPRCGSPSIWAAMASSLAAPVFSLHRRLHPFACHLE
jgi:Inorganic pyrophosphatase